MVKWGVELRSLESYSDTLSTNLHGLLLMIYYIPIVTWPPFFSLCCSDWAFSSFLVKRCSLDGSDLSMLTNMRGWYSLYSVLKSCVLESEMTHYYASTFPDNGSSSALNCDILNISQKCH